MEETLPTVVLVGVQTQGVPDADLEASLAEMARLVDTLGHEVVGRVVQKRTRIVPGTVLGVGKLKELAQWTGGTGIVPKGPVIPKKKLKNVEEEEEEIEPIGADEGEEGDEDGAAVVPEGPRAGMVVVDHDLTPSQLRNLAAATGVPVRDRTGVILDIFHRHAHTREARLQVEIARLTYLSPRAREAGQGDRVRGGVGGKGAGESDVEIDRRKVRDRISELKRELEAIEASEQVKRQRRSSELRVALVGYTNAGKSSMMRALTGSEVYVADQLFATLGTTVRLLVPATTPRVLVADTVGFIRDLPHDLVASFRSTLQEANEARLLLHLVDAADPDHARQIQVTREVLAEIGADRIPTLLCFNKNDKLDEPTREALRAAWPEAVFVSAYDPASVAALHGRIVSFFEQDAMEVELLVPHGARGIIGELRASTRVLEESWEQEGAVFRVRGTAAAIERLRGLGAR